jgi:hypothetical protein
MNPQDLQDEIKVLLRRLEALTLDRSTVHRPNPLLYLPDKVLSAAYLEASNSIKRKMVALTIVGRCPFQDTDINVCMQSILLDMTPPPTLTTWTHSNPQLDCIDMDTFLDALTDFVIQPLPQPLPKTCSVFRSIRDCIITFYGKPFFNHQRHFDEQSIIQAYVDHLKRRSRFTVDELKALPIKVRKVRSRDSSPTRK